MEDPVAEIPTVISLLTQSPPSIQQTTLTRYFTSSAAFTHPFCRTFSYDISSRLSEQSLLRSLLREGGPLPLLSSRALTGAIYRWYKVMSPTIELSIDSVAFDSANLVLYVSLRQTFRIAVLPIHRVPVHLVTVLELQESKGYRNGQAEQTHYLIKSQNDRYQVDEWIKFVSVFRILWALLLFGTFLASLGCVAGQAICWPIVRAEERWALKKAHERAEQLEDKKEEGKKQS